MRANSHFLFLIGFFVLGQATLKAQWSQTNGPTGGCINALTTLGSTIIAGTEAGAFRSTDNGAHWTAANTGLTNYEILALTSGERIFMGTGSDLVSSTDQGVTWSSSLMNDYVLSIATNGTYLLVGTYSGVSLSTDNGTNWTQVNNGLTNTTVQALAIVGSTFFAGTGNGLFLSTDQGASWHAPTTGPTNSNIRCFTVKDTNVYAGTWGGGVFVTSDTGAHWSETNNGFSSSEIVMSLYTFGTVLCVGTGNDGPYVSTDDGAHWNSTASLPGGEVHAFTSNNTTLFTGTRSSLYASTDTGKHWTEACDGMIAAYCSALGGSGSTIYAASGTNGVYLSTNEGTSWTASNNGLDIPIAYTIAVDGSFIYLGDNGGAHRSTDGGANWLTANTGFVNYNPVNAFFVDGTNLYSGGDDGVYLSTDHAANWTPAKTGLPQENPHNIIYALGKIGSKLIAATYDSGFFVSTNNAANWAPSSTGLPLPARGKKFVTVGTKIYAGLQNNRGVYVSADSCNSWTAINEGLTDLDINALASDGTNLFAGTLNCVSILMHGSTSWIPMATGLPVVGSNEIDALLVNGDYLYAAVGSSGVWRRLLSEMTDVKNYTAQNQPDVFTLKQNYPNPFNPTTTISFSLPTPSKVSLKVFDLLGREVAIIVSEVLSAGDHSRQWNASGFASGIYYYRLEAGIFVETKKLVLLR
ncbi:MAG: T9SS type A sorting domain-containing protein [Bacteroidota bacterium]